MSKPTYTYTPENIEGHVFFNTANELFYTVKNGVIYHFMDTPEDEMPSAHTMSSFLGEVNNHIDPTLVYIPITLPPV